MAVKIAITGALGRMGKILQEVLAEDKDVELVAALEVSGHPGMGTLIGKNLKVTERIPDTVKVDALIDFSAAAALDFVLKTGETQKCALILATTGYTPEQLDRIKEMGKKVPVCQSPNMSLGVNLFMRFAAEIAAALGEDYNVEIIESHHRHKKDAPSGTALKTAQKIAKALGRNPEKDFNYGREGLVGERPKNQIGIHAVRCGDIVGEHTVIFCSDGERLELTSRVHTRRSFAAGAVKLAKILASKKPGSYLIEELLFGK